MELGLHQFLTNGLLLRCELLSHTHSLACHSPDGYQVVCRLITVFGHLPGADQQQNGVRC